MIALADHFGSPVAEDHYGSEMFTETPLDPPPGRKKGLISPLEAWEEGIPQPHHTGKNFADLMRVSAIEPIPEHKWKGWIDAGLNMMPNSKGLYDQDGVGSCAAEGINGCVEVCRSIAGDDFVEFNPWGMYHYSSGGTDRGSTLQANLELAKTMGCIPADVWGRDKGWRAEPSAEAKEAAKNYRILEYYRVRNKVEWATAVFNRFPVYGGYSGHAWFCVGIANTNQLIWRNSWGRGWGDNGYGILDFSRVVWQYGAYAIQVATEG